MCRRPCLYFAQGRCANGPQCAYCHLAHLERTPKLDKRQRALVQGLERPSVAHLVLQLGRAKAQEVRRLIGSFSKKRPDGSRMEL